jgi:hypothetical protein
MMLLAMLWTPLSPFGFYHVVMDLKRLGMLTIYTLQ